MNLNRHRTSLAASTIVERVQKIVEGVIAKMPARNQVISAAEPLWDILLPSHQSLLENLDHDLSGNLIKELDAVTIHFKVGVSSK